MKARQNPSNDGETAGRRQIDERRPPYPNINHAVRRYRPRYGAVCGVKWLVPVHVGGLVLATLELDMSTHFILYILYTPSSLHVVCVSLVSRCPEGFGIFGKGGNEDLLLGADTARLRAAVTILRP